MAALLGVLIWAPASVSAAAKVGITLSCNSNPERTTVKNNTNATITVRKVGSTYKPYSWEPKTVNRSLGAGKSITFQTGYAASGPNKLSGNFIYASTHADGARVVTSIGTFTKAC